MAYPISNVYRRVQYSGSAGTGPYSFSFEILSNTDVSVYKNQTLLTLTTNYTVTINVDGTGYVTLTSAATGSDTVTIYGARAIERTSDFVTGGDLFANTLNDELDSLVIFTQQNKEEISRALMVPVTDPTTVNLTLPGKTSRAGYVLSFNSTTGNPEVTTTVGQINQAQTYAANALTSQNAAAASAAAALTSQGAAATSASAASASAASAAASVNGGMYSAVQDKSGNYTIASTDAGDLIRVDTTSGVITITLPVVGSAGIDDGFKVAVVKWTNDANAVSVVRSGSNTINGSNTYSIGSQYTSATFVADAETGQWFGAASGVGTANIVSDVFSGTGSQTVFTLSGDPGSKNNTFVYVGGVYQQKATYTQSGATITFSTAPPSGSSNVEIIWIQPQAIGVPSDGTVSTAKIANSAVTVAKISATGTPSASTALKGDGSWGTVGFSGATVTTSAVDITLTSASSQTQAVSMTAASKYVILPDATTLGKGGPAFIIQNKGQNPFGVKDAAGNVVTPMLYYGQSVSLVLLANATTAGSWGALAIDSAGLVATGPVNVSTSLVANSAYVRVAGLSSTQALIAYYNTAGLNTQVMLATISGTTVTFGSPTTLLASSNTILGCVGLSSSLAVFLVLNGSSVLQAVAVSVSGSTLTVGTAAAVTAIARCAGISENVLADTSTSGVVTFGTDNGSTVALTTRGFTVAGTTITFGTAQNLLSVATGGSGAAAYVAAVKLATGSYVSIFYSGNSGLAYAQPFTLSGNTVTLGTQTTYSSNGQTIGIISTAAQPGGGYAASSTCGVFSYLGYSVSVNISGTTISSIAPTYGGPSTYDANVAVLGYPQPFGTTGALASDIYGGVTAYTGSSNGFGGATPIVFANMQYTSNAYLDATTNIVAGIFGTGYVGAVIVKGN